MIKLDGRQAASTIDEDGIVIDDKANKMKFDAKGGAVTHRGQADPHAEGAEDQRRGRRMKLEIKGGTDAQGANAAMVKIN